MLPKYFMVFDVESVGLHGEGFAVGWVVLDQGGHRVSDGKAACDPHNALGSEENRRWISENVPPQPVLFQLPSDVRSLFWREWLSWKKSGAVLLADCCWPVEARFLAACVDDDPTARNWEGPYPLHDLASILLALDGDPLATNERLPNELPQHDPLCDARQSARLLAEALLRKGSV